MHQRHQAYTLYYRNVYILVFLRVFVLLFFSLLRYMLKSNVLRVGVGVNTLRNTILTLLVYQLRRSLVDRWCYSHLYV